MDRFFRGVGLWCVFATAMGCKPAGTVVSFQHNRTGAGTPVAHFGDDSITVEELQERFLEMSPYARARYQTAEQRKEYVEGMARSEVLAQEAIRRGLQNDPDVVEAAKRVMVQKLIQKDAEAKNTPATDTELTEFYEKHKTDYVKPENVRLSEIFLAAPVSDAAARKSKRALADGLLQKAKELPPRDFSAFGKLAHESSEDAMTKPLDGDTRYISVEELSAKFSPELAKAATELKSSGDLSPVIETDKGFYVAKLQGRQAALNLTLDQVKPQLQGRIQNERRQQNFEQLVASLKEKSHYSVDDAALVKVQVDMKAPTKEAKRSPPGFIPGVMGR
jgi:peptidyl-prolyl cis-trans isomerase C